MAFMVVIYRLVEVLGNSYLTKANDVNLRNLWGIAFIAFWSLRGMLPCEKFEYKCWQ